MDILVDVFLKIFVYAIVLGLCIWIVWLYIKKLKRVSLETERKVDKAKLEGRFIPISLHPHIDLNTCIGSGACIKACPEKDILGIVHGQATVINSTSCIGHGACFHACPVEAISLRIGTEERGVELPHVNPLYESNVEGIYIAGELGGMGLIKNSVEQGNQAVNSIINKGIEKKEGIYDLIIIGAGPAGISASLTAKRHNLDFLTLDQDSLGGTVYTYPRAKVVMTNPMHLELYGKVKLTNTSKDELLSLWNDALSKNNIKIEEFTKVDQIILKDDHIFRVVCANEKDFLTQNVLLAIGRRGTPRKLNIKGENLPKVAYRLLDAEKLENNNIVVVGGGDSAIESALLLMDKNNVTLSYRKTHFSRLKAKNQTHIEDAIANNKIKMLYNSNLIEIKDKEIVIEVEGKHTILDNDLVYIFIGGELPTKFLQNAGIKIEKRFNYIVKKH